MSLFGMPTSLQNSRSYKILHSPGSRPSLGSVRGPLRVDPLLAEQGMLQGADPLLGQGGDPREWTPLWQEGIHREWIPSWLREGTPKEQTPSWPRCAPQREDWPAPKRGLTQTRVGMEKHAPEWGSMLRSRYGMLWSGYGTLRSGYGMLRSGDRMLWPSLEQGVPLHQNFEEINLEIELYHVYTPSAQRCHLHLTLCLMLTNSL